MKTSYMNRLYTLALWIAVFWSGYASAQNISTIAGNGFFSYSGNNLSAVSAQMLRPNGITFDAAGNLYIADQANHCIRKINALGIITTIAGTPSIDGFSGDGGAATTALLKYPAGVAVDGSGNIFIADKENNRIRKISGGIITTIAGTGGSGYFGDGGVASTSSTMFNGPSGIAIDAAGNIYISDRYNNAIRKIAVSGTINSLTGHFGPGFSGDGGPSTSATIKEPTGVAVDVSGNVYIADYGNNRVRKISSAGIITTLAGTGAAGDSGDGGPATAAELSAPFSVRTDAAGNVYISDNGNSKVRVVNTSGIINTLAGTGSAGYSGDGGPATNAMLYEPQGVAVNSSGSVFVADGSWRIRKIASGIISTYGGGMGNGLPATANAVNPICAAVDGSGNVYIADADNNRVCKVTPAGIIQTIAGNGADSYDGDGGPATAAALSYPAGICMDKSGNIYIADQNNDVIRKVSTSGIISTVAGNNGHGYSGDGGPATAAMLSAPTGVAVDAAGNMYISDRFNNLVRFVDVAGTISTIAGNASGSFADGIPATAARLKAPNGVAVDRTGNIYIAESGNNAVRRISAGIITTVAGTGTFGWSGDGGPATAAKLNYPTKVVVDTIGNIFIADATNNRCRKVNVLGNIYTVAGDTSAKLFGGDGGPATAAHLNFPNGLALDASGTLYIADYDNFRVRKVQPFVMPPIKGILTVCESASVTLSNTKTGGTWTSMNTLVAIAGSSSGIVTGVSAGTATIVYDLSGNTVIATVTVNPLPYAGTISGPANVCAGSSVSLTDAIPGGSWTRKNTTAVVSGGVVTGISAGTNVISYSVTNSCGTAYALFPMTVDPLPTAGTLSSPSTVCVGATVSISSSVPGGVWSASNTNLTVSGGGLISGYSVGSTIITYAVTTTCGSASATKIVSVSPLPDAGTISGAASVCTGSSITLSDPVTGGTWLCSNTTASVAGGIVSGHVAGTDTILYSVTNSCGTASAAYTVAIDPLPPDIIGTAGICKGSSVALSDIVPGGVWSSSATSIASVGSVVGYVSALSAGTATITYELAATGCYTTLVVTVYPLPSVFAVTGGGAYCAGGSGVHIGLSGSSSGNMYQLYNGPTATGGPRTGTGGAVDFGLITGAGSYTVSATNATTGCVSPMSASATVSINSLPALISGASRVCAGLSTAVGDATPGGTWSSSNTSIATVHTTSGSVSGLVAGVVNITYTLTTGCYATMEFTVNPQTNAGTITGASTLCVDSSVLFTSSVFGGVWSVIYSRATVSPSGLVTGKIKGTEAIVYTKSGICGDAAATQPLAILQCDFTEVKVLADMKQEELRIWPNPATDVCAFTLSSGAAHDVTFVLYDIHSRKIREAAAETNKVAMFDVSNLPAGLYHLAAISPGTHHDVLVSVIH